ncbi:hypothetical protein QJ043_07195 [Olsenella sp. YH-ols2217]|uniref:Lipoprotein n=1 Tax=Kribbibacterium absianum TaxID=3044210 RepID=A0ABT6ZLC7_9ACTN|nr:MULTISPECIES: hypothetical protein [unclassified Olsenella]MDJ1121852.1 hypothetical protein [Olsenella sp. YH-ols2216]MDJ1129860.1 hypothetical protein [Olsenella sp. YH-ols2217]
MKCKRPLVVLACGCVLAASVAILASQPKTTRDPGDAGAPSVIASSDSRAASEGHSDLAAELAARVRAGDDVLAELAARLQEGDECAVAVCSDGSGSEKLLSPSQSSAVLRAVCNIVLSRDLYCSPEATTDFSGVDAKMIVLAFPDGRSFDFGMAGSDVWIDGFRYLGASFDDGEVIENAWMDSLQSK